MIVTKHAVTHDFRESLKMSQDKAVQSCLDRFYHQFFKETGGGVATIARIDVDSALERERARERQAEAGKNSGKGVERVPQAMESQGKSRDIVGEKLGVSGRHIEKSIKVVKKIDELAEAGETKEAAKLTKTLNASVSRAHQEVKAMDIVEAEKGQLVIDVYDAKGLEKAVWDYTQANSMAVRWRSFVKELLQMSKFRSRLSGTLITMISW